MEGPEIRRRFDFVGGHVMPGILAARRRAGAVLAALLILVAGLLARSDSAAGPNTNAKLLLHVAPVVSKGIGACGVAIPDCFGLVTAAPLNPEGYFVYLLVSDLDPEAGIGGLQCGVSYDPAPGSGIDVVSWRLCAAAEYPHGTWPEVGGGNFIAWNIGSSHPVTGCQKDPVAVAGYFYISTYSPDRLALRPFPVDGRVKVADCLPFPFEYDLTNHIPNPLGFVDIGGGAGANPCQGDVPLPDLIVTSASAAPTRITTAETVSLDAIVRNVGGGSSGPVAYTVTVDGARSEKGTLPALAPGAETSLSTAVSGFKPGFRFLGLYADSDDNYGEPNELNNFTGIAIQVDVAARIEPSVLLYRLRGGSASSLAFAIELDAPYDAGDIDARSVRFNGYAPLTDRERVGDADHDGVTDMTLKFPGEAATVGASAGADRRLSVEGSLGDGNSFRGTVTVRIEVGNRLSEPDPSMENLDAAGRELFYVRSASNPLLASGEIRYGTKTGGRVALRVLDPSGRLVRTLLDASVSPGERALRFDGRSDGGATISSGVYFLTLDGPEGRRVEKFVWRR
jgi:hypothetical protein